MSVPDYAEMGRELEANRDATLVNAANRGVKYHEELEAANQRIAELEHQITDLKGKLAVHDGFQYRFEATMEWQKQRAEAAERKLATARDEIGALATSLDDDAINRQEAVSKLEDLLQALAQIEQPQEPQSNNTDWEYCEHCRSWHAPNSNHWQREWNKP